MPESIDHPVLGKLVPDQWNDSLMTFREFPHMNVFWRRRREVAGIEPEHQAWLDDWQNHTRELAKICRNGEIYAWLQSRGIYEVTVGMPEDGDAAPTDAQVAAFRFFVENEQAICGNVIDAFLRFYRHAFHEMSDWMGDDEFPENPSAEELGKIVDFDGFTICRPSANGISPLRLSWDPDWDPEHGMIMIVHRDQVIGIGSEDAEELLHEPESVGEYGLWNYSQMTDTERAALREYTDNFEPADDEDEDR